MKEEKMPEIFFHLMGKSPTNMHTSFTMYGIFDAILMNDNSLLRVYKIYNFCPWRSRLFVTSDTDLCQSFDSLQTAKTSRQIFYASLARYGGMIDGCMEAMQFENCDELLVIY